MIILTNYRRYNLVIVFSAIMLVKSSLGKLNMLSAGVT